MPAASTIWSTVVERGRQLLIREPAHPAGHRRAGRRCPPAAPRGLRGPRPGPGHHQGTLAAAGSRGRTAAVPWSAARRARCWRPLPPGPPRGGGWGWVSGADFDERTLARVRRVTDSSSKCLGRLQAAVRLPPMSRSSRATVPTRRRSTWLPCAHDPTRPAAASGHVVARRASTSRRSERTKPPQPKCCRRDTNSGREKHVQGAAGRGWSRHPRPAHRHAPQMLFPAITHGEGRQPVGR